MVVGPLVLFYGVFLNFVGISFGLSLFLSFLHCYLPFLPFILVFVFLFSHHFICPCRLVDVCPHLVLSDILARRRSFKHQVYFCTSWWDASIFQDQTHFKLIFFLPNIQFFKKKAYQPVICNVASNNTCLV